MVEPGPSADATLKVEVTGLGGLLCSLDLLDSSTVKEAKGGVLCRWALETQTGVNFRLVVLRALLQEVRRAASIGMYGLS
eukprot:5150371-Alexandrium_andersonii.AAC.1